MNLRLLGVRNMGLPLARRSAAGLTIHLGYATGFGTGAAPARLRC